MNIVVLQELEFGSAMPILDLWLKVVGSSPTEVRVTIFRARGVLNLENFI